MKNERAKQKAVAAIGQIVRAAKELVKAEQEFYNRNPKIPRKHTKRQGDNDDR